MITSFITIENYDGNASVAAAEMIHSALPFVWFVRIEMGNGFRMA